ncbi:MAG: signal peptidase I [Clostridia bacterium]|nr:signal peptidase I [Clostridia bacterium]MBR5447915.1 signal peptidase I [Clostridia bacterium]
MKNNKKGLKTALRLILLVICGAILGVNVYLANANSLVGNQMPMPFGYGASVVLSGSMEPEFSKGDLIIVAEADSYKKGDVVVFPDGDDLVVHRIIEESEETVVTKGDANTVADEPIQRSAIKAKVLFHVDKVGAVVSFLKTPVGTILVIALAIALVEIPRRRQKEEDDEEKQKILEEIKRLREEQLKDAENEEN